MNQKSNHIEYPVTSLIGQRKSIRAFADKAVEPEKIKSLFEAARWAPSSVNEQPWHYIYATRDQQELWSKLFDALNEVNKVWVKNAPLLIAGLVRKHFSRNGNINQYALYDLGGANSFLAMQAVASGLQVRQMAGFDRERASANLNLPEVFTPAVFIAVGYPGNPESLPENLQLRENAPRERFLQEEFVMNRTF